MEMGGKSGMGEGGDVKKEEEGGRDEREGEKETSVREKGKQKG